MRSRPTVVASVFYVGLVVLITCILLELLPYVLPDELARRIGFNSEGILMALALGLWIQFVRPLLAGRPQEWPVTAAVAVGCGTVGLLLLTVGLPSRFKTLNETFLGLVVALVYLQLRRPLHPRVALGMFLVVLAVMAVASETEPVIRMAEALGVLLLMPLVFDVIDRGILDPEARTSPPVRFAWYAFLVIFPTTMSLLEHWGRLDGPSADINRYAVRLHESFVAILLIELYFAAGLSRTGVSGSATNGDGDRRMPWGDRH